MLNAGKLARRLSDERGSGIEVPPDPTKEDLRALVRTFKSDGLCGRRVAEHRLGPYFIASNGHGQREIELLDEILDEEYAETDLCVRTRGSECSRFSGGCKRYR